MRIVFLGTPEFAVASLKALVDNHFNIVGVITAPDRMGGRGRNQLIESAVKQYARKEGLKILQPTNLKNEQFVQELKSLHADLQIVVAFRMLPRVVWDMPLHGTYNLHGSLLPAYRGAAPINWAIIKGEEYTGVTTFKLKHEIDTGNIAFQKKILIERSDYLDDVYEKLMVAGAELIVDTVNAIVNDQIMLEEQDSDNISKAPKIFHEDCELDFSESCINVYNKIRGLSPIPVGWFLIEKKKVKVYKATYSYQFHELPPGTLLTDDKHFLAIACKDGFVFPTLLQVEGRKRTKIKDFLNGNWLTTNTPPSRLRIQSYWSR